LSVFVISVRGRKTYPIAIARKTINAVTDSVTAGIARQYTRATRTSAFAVMNQRNAATYSVSTDGADHAYPMTSV
jgi:hypothetical protein